MKRKLSMLLVAALAASLAGCNESPVVSEPTADSVSQTSSVASESSTDNSSSEPVESSVESTSSVSESTVESEPVESSAQESAESSIPEVVSSPSSSSSSSTVVNEPTESKTAQSSTASSVASSSSTTVKTPTTTSEPTTSSVDRPYATYGYKVGDVTDKGYTIIGITPGEGIPYIAIDEKYEQTCDVIIDYQGPFTIYRQDRVMYHEKWDEFNKSAVEEFINNGGYIA